MSDPRGLGDIFGDLGSSAAGSAQSFGEFTEAARSVGEETVEMIEDYAADFRHRHGLPADHPIYVAASAVVRDAVGDLPLPAGLRWGRATKQEPRP